MWEKNNLYRISKKIKKYKSDNDKKNIFFFLSSCPAPLILFCISKRTKEEQKLILKLFYSKIILCCLKQILANNVFDCYFFSFQNYIDNDSGENVVYKYNTAVEKDKIKKQINDFEKILKSNKIDKKCFSEKIIDFVEF